MPFERLARLNKQRNRRTMDSIDFLLLSKETFTNDSENEKSAIKFAEEHEVIYNLSDDESDWGDNEDAKCVSTTTTLQVSTTLKQEEQQKQKQNGDSSIKIEKSAEMMDEEIVNQPVVKKTKKERILTVKSLFFPLFTKKHQGIFSKLNLKQLKDEDVPKISSPRSPTFSLFGFGQRQSLDQNTMSPSFVSETSAISVIKNITSFILII